MSEQDQANQPQSQTVSPDQLLAQIVTHIGENFVVIPMEGWGRIVGVIKDSEDESLLQTMEDLMIPVIPVSLQGKAEESRIITPDNMPKGDSKIIV